MDLAKPKRRLSFWNYISFLIYLPIFWFIYHLFSIQQKYIQHLLKSGGSFVDIGIKSGGLKEFVYYRNIFYLIYLTVAVIIGLIMLFKKKKVAYELSYFNKIIPKLILSIIVTTFSYVIASILVDLYLIYLRFSFHL